MTRTRLAIALLLVTSVDRVLAAERLDDSASPQQRVATKVEWVDPGRIFGLTNEALTSMVAKVPGLEVRLDTSRFIGQRGRIFLGLPLNVRGVKAPNGLRMRWRGRGTFADGSVVPGNRALIFDNVIDGPLLSDILDITLEIDSRQVGNALNIEPFYEIETP